MTQEKQNIQALEKKHGLQLVGSIDLNLELTEDEFSKLVEETSYIGVNHSGRIKFLKDNGYEVTRENMVDSSLSARPKDEMNTQG